VAVLGVLATCLIAALGGGCASLTDPGAYEATVFTHARLEPEPRVTVESVVQYGIKPGDRLVILLKRHGWGAPLTFDTESWWIIQVELPAEALRGGTFSVDGAAPVEAIAATGPWVSYISQRAEGRVVVGAVGSGDTRVSLTITLRFKEPGYQDGDSEDMALMGTVEAELKPWSVAE